MAYPPIFPVPRRRKLKLWIRVLLFTILLGLGVMLADRQVRPVMETFALHQAQVAAVRAINQAVEEVLEQEEISYGDLVTLRHNSLGEITAIETHVIEFNLLRSRLTRAVDGCLQEQLRQDIAVPLGTIFGGNLLSGRGPLVQLRIVPIGYVHTSLANDFASAGINQTLHQIVLHIEAEVAAVIPGYTVSTTISQDFCVAETVIVGAVPEFFAGLEGISG